MKFFTKLITILIISFTCIIITSCYNSDDDDPNSPPVQTIRWQLDGNGYIQFMTNDSQYYSYSFWNTYTSTNQVTMTTVTATVKKISGSLYSGYGIVFCYQDTNNFYRLSIDAAGQFSVYKKVAGTYTAILPWTSSSSIYLNTGVGATNIISVTQTSLNNFSVNFNGSQETTFIDNAFTGGTAGFSAGVHDQSHENFPVTPEDIRYKMTSPVTYP
jgi:hypothetical protein